MHPEDIKAALRKKGSSQKKVADAMDVSLTTIHNVIHGACKSERCAKAIADIVGEDRSALWPGRYDTPAQRLLKAR